MSRAVSSFPSDLDPADLLPRRSIESGSKFYLLRQTSPHHPRNSLLKPFAASPTRIQASPSQLLAHPVINGLRDSIDAVVSASGLHWVGDIVGQCCDIPEGVPMSLYHEAADTIYTGALTQVRHLLKPDGVFLGAVLGGDTLFELRSVDHSGGQLLRTLF